jgi:transposase
LGRRAVPEARSAVGAVRRSAQDWPLEPRGDRVSEQRKYRSWTAQQKLEIVLAGMRGDRSVRDVCREHGIAETLYYGWRDRILEAGRGALAGKEERSGERELRRKIAELERALGRKTYELEIAGKALRAWE